jgi:mRNA interferase RelE/StbE
VPPEPYRIVVAAGVRRNLQRLPAAVVWACLEFIDGPLADNPNRVGKPLDPPFAGFHAARRGSYRVMYRINTDTRTVEILRVDHRADVYRP